MNMERFNKKIKDAKTKARSELKEIGDWNRMEFASNFCVTPDEVKMRDNVQRIDCRLVSKKEFQTKYEIPCWPVVITHALDQWPALKSWTMDKLIRKYRNQSFKCGEDDSGRSVRLKFKYFIKYMQSDIAAKDDSPLYIFDSNFGEHAKRKRLLNDYFIPEYFKDDLFQYASDYRRPPHRWFVMGSRRSGTNIHIDPLATSAWNSIVQGHKWWCLFPPFCEKSILKIASGEGWKNRHEAITWFTHVYPNTQRPDWPQHLKPIELLQSEGETVFVPWGWWHVVVNLDDTIAITQNFCSTTNLADVWKKTKISRPRLANNWINRLKILRSEIYDEICKMELCEKIDEEGGACSCSSSSSSSSNESDSDSDSEDSDVQAQKNGDKTDGRLSRSPRNDVRSASSHLPNLETSDHKYSSDHDSSVRRSSSQRSAPASRRSPSRKRMR